MYSPEQTSYTNPEGRESRSKAMNEAANVRDPEYLKKLASRIETLRSLAVGNKDQKGSILNSTDDFIARASAQNEAHKAESPKAPEAGDPRDALEVRMDYKDTLAALGGEVPPELAALKLAVDSIPRDATEGEKRGPMLAFLKGYEEFRKNLN
jgi:hypothetical protein